MADYLRSTRVRIGLVLLVFGTGSLAAVLTAAKLGPTDDPNPNPVVFGILAFFTFWPSVGLILSGLARFREDSIERRREHPGNGR